MSLQEKSDNTDKEEEKKEPWGMLIPSDESLGHISLTEKEFSLGRSNRCSFRISHPHISGVHFKITLQQVQNLTLVSIVDHSSNGTHVNQVRLEKGKRFFLKHMNTISLVHPKSKKWSFSFVDLSFADRERKDHSEILEKYDLCENIGHGTFSVVKRGVCKESGESFAIKIIDKSRFFHIEKTREQIQREVTILKQIKHPYIISIHDVIETNRWLYIILEMATGGDLFHSLELQAKFSEKDARRIFKQILEALQYLHNDKHTAHRDLKPENILLADKSPEADIKLTDFGLARMTTHHGESMTTMCGTPEYVAPEILFSSKNSTKEADGYGVQVDMWSAGALLYILLSGTLAFKQTNKTLLYQSIRKGNLTFSPEDRWVNVTESAKDLIKQLIEVDPQKRLTVDQALTHPWVTYNEVDEIPIPLDIRDALQFTLSLGSISFNVFDYEDITFESDEDPTNQTPKSGIESPTNETEVSTGKRQSEFETPSPKRQKTE